MGFYQMWMIGASIVGVVLLGCILAEITELSKVIEGSQEE